MRYDFFLIWGNGVDNTPDIIDMIRNDSNFNIIRIVPLEINDMHRFINEVYACDHVPMAHLINKTRYLLNSQKRCIFILVENRDPDETYCGSGAFRHIQCNKVKHIKEMIRNKFNPPLKDLRQRIPPLNIGVSHEHCVHASDYESQVDYMLEKLNMRDIQYYNRHDSLEYYFPFHLDFNSYELKCFPVDSLRCNILGLDGVSTTVEIQDTPHYQYVAGNHQPYIEYFVKYFGKQLQEDHFPKNFDKLICNFDIDYKTESGKETYVIIKDNVVKDGVHRLCIMKHLGVKEVKCIQIS